MLEDVVSLIVAEFGEKIIVLRHDVDNVYTGVRGWRKLKLAANRFLLASGRLGDKLSLAAPRRLELVEELLDLENQLGAKATYFFRSVTAPTARLAKKLESKGCRIGYHADSLNPQVFQDRLAFLEKTSGASVVSYTWHGFSKVRGGGRYEEEKLLDLGRKAGLKILAQGQGHRGWPVPRLAGGIWVFGHSASMKRQSLSEILRYASGHHIPLLLAHPEDVFATPDRRRAFETLLERFRGVAVEDLIEVLRKISRESVGEKLGEPAGRR